MKELIEQIQGNLISSRLVFQLGILLMSGVCLILPHLKLGYQVQGRQISNGDFVG